MSRGDAVLAKIRAGLGVEAGDEARRAAIERRLKAPQRRLIPERAAAKPPEALRQLLRGFLEGRSATVIDVASPREVPSAVAGYLRANNLPARVRMGADADLAMLPWQREPSLEVMRGRADPADEVGLSRASSAVAETGTLVIESGPDNPVTLNFLPETHIVVVHASNIVGPYEDAWDSLRARFGAGNLPRTVNMISGPSCTGDIGAKIVMGAHGPRRLCVIIVGHREN